MATGWTTDETFKFIELYKKNSLIWNPYHKSHREKTKVNDAWTRIADEMGISVVDAKKKKETLLTAFRMNHKKVILSRKAGGEVYKPMWIFYDALASFMRDIYTCTLIQTEDDGDCIKVTYETQEMPSRRSQQLNSSQPDPGPTRRSKRQLEMSKNSIGDKSLLSGNNSKTLPNNNLEVQYDEDDCDLYGRLLANAMREFDEIDRLELRHEIDGLIIQKKRKISNSTYNNSYSPNIDALISPPNSHSIDSELVDGRPLSAQSDYSSSPYEKKIYIKCPSTSSSSAHSSPTHF